MSGPAANGKHVLSGKGEVMETERISEENKHLHEKAVRRESQQKEIQVLCEQALTRADAIERCLKEAEDRIDASERRAKHAHA